jgi:signal peptidase I
LRIKRDSTAGSIIELIVVVGAAIAVAFLVQQFFVKPYRIPSGSMEPTLNIGQRVLVNRVGEHFGDPSVGEILVFHPPQGADTAQCGNVGQGPNYPGSPRKGFPCDKPTPQESEQTFIKRVVAGPGDVISVRQGYAVVNGKLETASYIRACGGGPTCELGPIRIPAGHWFMMGDNRGDSMDSRYWGPIPKSWVIGKAFATYWPPNRVGLL